MFITWWVMAGHDKHLLYSTLKNSKSVSHINIYYAPMRGWYDWTGLYQIWAVYMKILIHFQVKGTFIGEATSIFATLWHRGHFLMERICSLCREFLLLRADCFWRTILTREANRKVRKLFPFEKMSENHFGVSLFLKSVKKHNFVCYLMLDEHV